MAIPNLMDAARYFGLVEDPSVAIEEGSPLTIIELTGLKRSVRLSGRAMPLQKIPFSGTMRCEQTFYPGNPIATIQVLGSTEDETVINGKWSDRYLNRAADPNSAFVQVIYGETGGMSPITGVMELCQIIDDVRLQGQLLRVTWDEIARDGILSKFRQEWHRRTDVDWEMTFTWQSQAWAPPPLAAPAPAATDNYNSILHFAQGLIDTATKYYNTVQLGLAVEQEFISRVNATMARIETSLQALEDTTSSAVDVGRRAAAIYEYIGDTASELIGDVDSTPPRNAMSAKRADQLSPGAVIASENWLQQVRNRARTVRNFAYTKAYEHAISSDPVELIKVFRAHEGQDLRDVSKLFYSTPEEWKSLLQFNRMASSKLVAGQLVYVPRQPARNG